MIWNASGGATGTIMVTSAASFNAKGKTLIISSHGKSVGATYTPAYPNVVQFATPKGGALIAGLKDVIDGKVEASEISIGGKKTKDEYQVWHYEHDPTPSQVEGYLSSNTKVDVMMFANNAPSFYLSWIISFLHNWGENMQYPTILCIFCRISQETATFTYHGHQAAPAVQDANRHQADATAVGLQLASALSQGKTLPSQITARIRPNQ